MTTVAVPSHKRTSEPDFEYLTDLTDEELLRGWRFVRQPLPDGREVYQQVLLTLEDFLNPQEGDFVPEDTFHDIVTNLLADMLRRHLARRPELTVYSDLVLKWPARGLPNAAPDVAVIRKEEGRGKEEEGRAKGAEGARLRARRHSRILHL